MPASCPISCWTVLKFGGTSVSSRARWNTIGELARRCATDSNSRVLVVVSALAGVTNELTAVAEGASDSGERVAALVARHYQFLDELDLAPAVLTPQLTVLQTLLDDVRAEERTLDWQAEVLAQGELLSSTIGAAYLRQQGVDIGWMDARQWLHAADPAPNQSPWSQRLSVNCQWQSDADFMQRFAAQETHFLITQGFIARHHDGGTAILGRGGSDTSAAYFGALLQARQVEIWTDVPGMFSANPKEVPDARLLTRLHYFEAQEIATTGAKVLHPRAIRPCRNAGVPLAILDTQRPHLPGTRIDRHAEAVIGVKAISRRNGIALVSMEGIGMWQQVGFLADIFAVFKQHGLSVDLISTSETNVTVSLDPADNLITNDILNNLANDLNSLCRVKVISSCSAITLVGRGMRSLLDKLSQVWARFGKERVHMVSQSSNNLNLTFVIDESAADGLLPVLHEKLIDSGAMPVHENHVFGPRWREINGGVRPRITPWWQATQYQDALLSLAENKTPSYVYHLPTVRQRAQQLKAITALDHYYYAIKANAHPAILQTLVAQGFGLECVSWGEIEHVFTILPQLPATKILFTPSFSPISEYQTALQRGITVTVDNIELLQRWPDVFAGHNVWLRIDLGYGEGHHQKVQTGGKEAKFGLALSRVDEFINLARDSNIRITGLHAHLGSGIDSVSHWQEMIYKMAAIAQKIGTIKTLDIGGGLPIPYTSDDEPFDLITWGNGLKQAKTLYSEFDLVIEPGRFLVAEAGILLAKVTQIVEKDGIHRVGLDAGMNTLLRPALYDAWHDIVNLSRLHETCTVDYSVVGPICESSDVFAQRLKLPSSTVPGDVILIADAGAYGFSMASHYNRRGLPNEAIIDDES